LVEEGVFKTIFAATDTINADIYTENTPEATFKRHQDKNMEDVRVA
jgi:hypothetical protein